MRYAKTVYMGFFLYSIFMLSSRALAQTDVSNGFCWVAHEKATGLAQALDVDRSFDNNIVSVGVFAGTVTFDDGGQQEASFESAGGFDGFMSSYDAQGNLQWAKVIITGDKNVTPRAVYNDGNSISVTGWFLGTATFGPGDANETTLSVHEDGNRDIFVARFDDDGELRWVRKLGGSGSDRAFDIYEGIVTGTFHGEIDLGNGVEFSSRGEGDILIADFDFNGNLQWARQIGSDGDDRGYGVIVDNTGVDTYVCGEFSETVTFGDGEANETKLSSKGQTDIFVARLNSFDGDMEWVKRAGGPSVDRARDVSIEDDSPNGVFVTGWFIGPADFDSQTLNDKGGGDIFLARYAANDGDLRFVVQAGGPRFEQGNKVAAIRLDTDSGPNAGPQFATALITGEFRDTITFGKGEPTETTLTSNGDDDVYVAKYNELGHFLWAKQIGGPGEDDVRGIDIAEFDFTNQPSDIDDISNSFIAGSFSSRVEFGGVGSFTAQEATDIFVTRLSDFIPPHDLTLEGVDNTPYLKLTWDAPINELAPTITLDQISSVGQPATQLNASLSTIFKVTIDYEAQIDGDDDVNQDAEVLLVSVLTPEGTEVKLQDGSVEIGGNGESGEISFEVLARFGFGDSVPLDFAIKDAAGNVSNYISTRLDNPDNSALTQGEFYQEQSFISSVAANEPVCNASINLLGYNIYRDQDDVTTFRGFVPAHFTMFVDEFTDPNQLYTYRVTAVYAEGESEHVGNLGPSGEDLADVLFDKLLLDGAGHSSAGVWGDYDNDDDLDLFIPNQLDQNNSLFRNDGGNMVRMTAGDPVSDSDFSYSASWADYDNDGWLDLFVANGFFAAGRNNFLYHNNSGTLTRVTSGQIVATAEKSTSGVWGDYNNDGWLDLFVTNNLLESNALFRNNRDGTFSRENKAPVTTDANNSYHADWVDYNNDGYLDIFVANNGKNDFYQNQGPPDFDFQKISASDVGAWLDENRLSRGASWADYDNDGDLDLFIANEGADNRLLLNNGSPNYSFQVASVTAVNNDGGKSRGSSWGDLDNDGDQDLFVTNLSPNIGDPANNNFLYFNQGNGDFSKKNQGGEILGNLIFDESAADGCSWADFNGDGFVDIIVTNGSGKGDGKNVLYRNNKQKGSNSNNWVSIRAIGNGVTSNRSALGARVHVRASINGSTVTQMQYVSGQTGGGWGGQNSMNMEFGLGNAAQIDELIIFWPGGQQTTRTGLAVNTFYEFTENTPPRLENEIADQMLTADETPLTRNLNANPRIFTDPDGDALTYSAESSNNSVATASISGTVLTVTPIAQGNATISVTADDGNGGQTATTFEVEVQAGMFTIAGRVFYVNAAQSSVRNATVQANSASDVTGSDGRYQLTVSPGNHTLTTTKTDDWGGVNSADALKVLQHFVGSDIIPEGLRRLAADVNNSGTINAADAQRILQRFVGIIDAFAKPDWLFEQQMIDVNVNLSNVDIAGIATGDVNVSHTPPTLSSSESDIRTIASFPAEIELVTESSIQVTPATEFELPVRANSDLKLGAISLRLQYPEALLRYAAVTSNTISENLISHEHDGAIGVAWVDMRGGQNPIEVKRGEALLKLKFTPLREFEKANLILLPGSELTNPAATPIAALLELATISSVVLPQAFALHQNYPNPFNPTTNIAYDLKEEAHVKLIVTSVLGKRVATLVDERQTAGTYKTQWDATGLATGVYLYRLHVTSDTERFVQNRKLLLLK